MGNHFPCETDEPANYCRKWTGAEGGVLVKWPFGTPKKMPHFNKLLFLPRQMAQLPTPDEVTIETKTVIGPAAKAASGIGNSPSLLQGMAFGLALSERVKLALAKGATLAGTATNAGEGAVLPRNAVTPIN